MNAAELINETKKIGNEVLAINPKLTSEVQKIYDLYTSGDGKKNPQSEIKKLLRKTMKIEKRRKDRFGC